MTKYLIQSLPRLPGMTRVFFFFLRAPESWLCNGRRGRCLWPGGSPAVRSWGRPAPRQPLLQMVVRFCRRFVTRSLCIILMKHFCSSSVSEDLGCRRGDFSRKHYGSVELVSLLCLFAGGTMIQISRRLASVDPLLCIYC